MIKKRIGKLVAVSIILVILIAALFGKQGFISLYKNHTKYRQQSEELIKSHQIIDSLNVEISHLKNDTSYIERIAREKLGMARKNEKVYKFVQE
jgi:cell division protein FtsB